MNENKNISCISCGFSAKNKAFIKSCGNCFACTGCEIYICPECSTENVFKLIDNKRSFRKLDRL